MALDKQPHDLTAIPIGIGEFSLSEDAATAAAAQLAGFDDFGNLTVASLQSKSTPKEHKGSYRDGKRIDKTSVIDTLVGYQIKCDEITARKMRLYFYGSQITNFTQVVRSAVAADTITSPVIYKWYDILIGGVRIRELTVVASATGVEDTDYVVDYQTSRIRAISATGFGALTITAPAILVTSSNTMKMITPQSKSRVTGMGRMLIFDSETNTKVIDHADFGCEVRPSGNVDWNDKEAEMTFDILVTSPRGLVGMPK
jgi:hypothetical protein